MDRRLLERYKKNKRELTANEYAIERLYERLEAVPVVSGKVSKSSDDYPYVEEHMTVQMAEPVEASRIKDRILFKEFRNKQLRREMQQVEDWIRSLPEGLDREIMELVYLEGMTQQEAGNTIGYTKGRISQIISRMTKD